MTIKSAVFALLTNSLLLCMSAAYGQYRVVMEPSPPLQYFADNQIKGSVVQKLKEAFSHSRISADFQIYPWPRAFDLALNDEMTFLSNVARTPEREKQLKWIEVIHRYEFGLVGINDLIVADTLSDALNYTVAVQRGDVAHRFLLDNGFSLNQNLFLTTDITESWVLLNLGKVDFIIEDRHLLPSMSSKFLTGNNLVTTFIPIPELAIDAWLAANPAIDDNVLEMLHKALQEQS